MNQIFFENISKTTADTVVQNFSILDGTADLLVEIWPKFFCQFSAVMWWTYAETFNEISQMVWSNCWFTEKFWWSMGYVQSISTENRVIKWQTGNCSPEVFKKSAITLKLFEISYQNFQHMFITCLR